MSYKDVSDYQIGRQTHQRERKRQEARRWVGLGMKPTFTVATCKNQGWGWDESFPGVSLHSWPPNCPRHSRAGQTAGRWEAPQHAPPDVTPRWLWISLTFLQPYPLPASHPPPASDHTTSHLYLTCLARRPLTWPPCLSRPHNHTTYLPPTLANGGELGEPALFETWESLYDLPLCLQQ